MLSLAVRNSAKLVRAKSKSDNVRLSRFFTKKETAILMAAMPALDPEKAAYTILDPGAGTGILSAALVERICKSCPACKQIFLTCYETDPDFAAMLRDNLERIRKKARHDYDVRLYATVFEENYITESQNHYTVTLFDTVEDKFDLVICNPPTAMVDKWTSEAIRAGGVTQVKINAAYLFAKLAARHLEDGGKLVIMLPTTVASASALSAYRREMADLLSLERIHLFVGKQKNDKRAVPLKKSIILAYGKGERPEKITVSTSTDWGKPAATTVLPPLDYDFIVDKADGSLTLPKSVGDTRIVQYISAFPETLESLGLKMSTGLVIDSRCDDMLRAAPERGCAPLIRPAAIKGGQIKFPTTVGKQYVSTENSAIVQKNKNLVIVKRVPAGSDERFVNAAVYLASQLPEFRQISTHNKINFIDTKDKDGEMSQRLAFGLFALLNSTIYDRYLSIISKSKQINAKEMRTLPLPPRGLIENIGVRIMAGRQTDVAFCDSVVNPMLHIKAK